MALEPLRFLRSSFLVSFNRRVALSMGHDWRVFSLFWELFSPHNQLAINMIYYQGGPKTHGLNTAEEGCASVGDGYVFGVSCVLDTELLRYTRYTFVSIVYMYCSKKGSGCLQSRPKPHHHHHHRHKDQSHPNYFADAGPHSLLSPHVQNDKEAIPNSCALSRYRNVAIRCHYP